MQDSTKTYQAANPLTTARAHAGADYAPVRDTLLTGDELFCLYDDGEGHTSLWRMTALDAAGELRDIDFCIEETETEENGSFDNPYLDLPRELAYDPFTGQPRLLTALEFLEALQRWNSAQAIAEADADSVARLAQLYLDAFAQLPSNTVAAAWGGDDADAMLKRVEYDVVSYFQDTVPLSLFRTPAQLERWLTRHLAVSPLRAEVRSLRRWEPDRENAMLFLTKHIVKDKEDRYYPWLPHTDFTPEMWVSSFDNLAARPGLVIDYDGAAPQDYTADFAVHRADFPADAVFSTPAQDVDGTQPQPTWWMLSFPDLDIHLCIEHTAALLELTVDRDGQSVALRIQLPEDGELLRRVEAHRRRWAELYDAHLADPVLIPAAAALATHLDAVDITREA